MSTLEVILPPRDIDALSDHLVALTEAIDTIDPERVAHGFLGGSHGYGGHWDSPVFQMRPFCWCESDDCPWCMGCDCPEGAFHYFVDGTEVAYAEYQAFFDRETGPSPEYKGDGWKAAHDAWMKRAEVANRRRTTRHDPECAYCRGERFAEKGATAGKTAPNFWHKPSGLKVWWYKYIGRSQEVAAAAAAPDLAGVFAECLRDVQGHAVANSIHETQT